MTTVYQGGGFDMGRVVQRMFAAISQNGLVFFVSAALLIGLPSLVNGYGQMQNMTGQFAGWPMVVIGSALSIVGSYILQGLVVFAAVNSFNGKRIDLGAALSVGVKFFFPLLGLAILMGLGVGVGFILLIVPGLILTVMWIVAAPSLVIENRGIGASFSRSRDLTRGNRWAIFALLVIYFIVNMIITWTVIGVGMAIGGGFAQAEGVWPVALVLTPLVNVVSGIVSASGAAAIYYELRQVKEGATPDQLASVFD